jgi:hypothetical protein
MANWTAGGFVGRMFRTISKYIAPQGMPPPVLWGDEGTVERRLKGKVRDLRLTRRMHCFEYPFPPEDVVSFFRAYYGPMNRAFAALDLSGQKALHRELVDLWSSGNKGGGRTTNVDGEYLEVIATRALTQTLDRDPSGCGDFLQQKGLFSRRGDRVLINEVLISECRNLSTGVLFLLRAAPRLLLRRCSFLHPPSGRMTKSPMDSWLAEAAAVI